MVSAQIQAEQLLHCQLPGLLLLLLWNWQHWMLDQQGCLLHPLVLQHLAPQQLLLLLLLLRQLPLQRCWLCQPQMMLCWHLLQHLQLPLAQAAK
jgi:hypothetical protein